MIQGGSMLLAGLLIAAAAVDTGAGTHEKGELAMDVISGAQWRFGGELGRRVDANVENWLLRAPDANPGLLEMFRRRDRHLPYETPVPWAGEFAGKYLISAVQACRMSDDARLKPHVQTFVDALVASQDEDGYLGPWPKHERLLGHWDLWGHYHCMLGLLMWYDDTGDEKALECAIRAADCICDIYVDGDRRPIDAGTPQINLSVLYVLGDLYRRTGTARYRDLMQRIEEDMQQDGDWLRLGARGTPYYKLPGGGTRWESLHIVQGLVELYRITGEDDYKKAVVSLWESIRQYDRHPSGAFSTHERAFGSVYEPGAIETCCSVAWEALTIDALRLTGDPRVADELELTTWNQVLAAQHPSGSWWTYDTPLDGVRAPSFQQISFQHRPGTPELNCCSVNAPRGLGMLSEWAVMQDDEGVVLNFYGPSRFDFRLRDGQELRLSQDAGYPVGAGAGADVVLEVSPQAETVFTLKLRIPAWSSKTRIWVNGAWDGPDPSPGTYLRIERAWKPGDVVKLAFDMSPRLWFGQDGRYGRAAVYVGPLLLAFDAYFNDIETADLPALDPNEFAPRPVRVHRDRRPGCFPPFMLWEAQAANGTPILLCDFASAGAHGTDYVAWLPIVNAPPPAVKLQAPKDGAVGQPGPVLFRWTERGGGDCHFEILVARDPRFGDVVTRVQAEDATHTVLREELGEGTYHWKVRSVNAHGESENRDGARSFRIATGGEHSLHGVRDDGLMVASALDGDGTPLFGRRAHEQNLVAAPDRHGNEGRAVAFNGKDSELRYELPYFPEENYTFCAWVCPEGLPVGGLEQVFSAWCMGMDDPLRVSLQGTELTARIEAGSLYTTPGVPLQNGEWVHVAAVKQAATLTLYLNGKAVQSASVPKLLRTQAEQIGLGFNPLFRGGEHYHGRIDGFAFYARALSSEEVEGNARLQTP